ncbi:MAG: transposase [Dehalococcoidia bacterium]
MQSRGLDQRTQHPLCRHDPPRPTVDRLQLVRGPWRRGEPNQRLRNALAGDRLSDHRFWPNAFRLLLHAAASWLLHTLRCWLADTPAQAFPFDTLRLRLLKIGGRVWPFADRVRLASASSHPAEPLWLHLASRFRPPMNNPSLKVALHILCP